MRPYPLFGGTGSARRFGRKVPFSRDRYVPGEQDFAGKWRRMTALTEGLVEGYIARGHTREKSTELADKPYIQTWRQARHMGACHMGGADEAENLPLSKVGAGGPAVQAPEWELVTYNVDGVTPRRYLTYHLGFWDEPYVASTMFGKDNQPGLAKRHTAWLPDPNSVDGLAHVTLSTTPCGEEEARRYVRADGLMILKRSFRRNPTLPMAQSTEYFERISTSTDIGLTPEEHESAHKRS